MPTYLVSTLSVTESIDADTPKEAAAKSSYATLTDPVQLVQPLHIVTPSAGAPEASFVPLVQTASPTDSQAAGVEAE